MTEQDLADVVQIAVDDLNPDHPVVLENHEVTDEHGEPPLKRQRIEINCQDPSIKSFLYSINQTICLRLDSIEAKLLALDATCKSLEEKLDLVMNKQHSPIQVPMVAGSPLGATQTCNKVCLER
ncbi:hypothetical protein E2320_001295 [Naja naja]|nr:hypothetical protein E2320_001295 [Naja naja]